MKHLPETLQFPLQKLDKTNGRLQMFNGMLYYSPNDNRTLSKLPVSDPSSELASRTFKSGYALTTSPLSGDSSSVYSPRWWSPEWGWTAFIPNLANAKSQDSLFTEYPYRKQDKTIQSILEMGGAVYHAADILHKELGIGDKGLKRPFSDARYYKPTLERISVWLGFLAYLVFETEQDKERWDYHMLRWVNVLQDAGFRKEWCIELYSRAVRCNITVKNQEPGPRASKPLEQVGTFIDLRRPNAERRPEVLVYMLSTYVPLWYRWLPEYSSHPRFSFLSPLPGQVQQFLSDTVPTYLRDPLMLVLTAYPDIQPPEGASGGGDVPPAYPGISNDTHWQTFFRLQRFIRFWLSRDEMFTDFWPRKDYETPSRAEEAKVFEWRVHAGLGDSHVMQGVPASWREETLKRYPLCRKRYDHIANHWDCWQDPNEKELSETQRGPRAMIEWQRPVHQAPIVKRVSIEEPSRCPFTVDMDPILCLSTSQATPSSSLSLMERYILYVMYRFYGFIPPSDPPLVNLSTHVTFSGIRLKAENARFLRFLGIPLGMADIALFSRPSIIASMEFVNKMAKQEALLRTEFMNFPDEKDRATFLRRLSTLTVIPLDGSKNAYMFDFSTINNTRRPNAKWRLTVFTATHALLVCRLPPATLEYHAAFYLALHGIPFKTMMKASMLEPIASDSKPSRSIPHMPDDHLFDREDYMNYITGTQEILDSPRCARAALMSGGFPWRVAMMYVNLYSVLEGPTGWSDCPEEIFAFKVPDSDDVYIDDALTDVESKLLCGLTRCVTKDGQWHRDKYYYPPNDIYIQSAMNCGRWMSTSEILFHKWADGSKTGLPAIDDLLGPMEAYDWEDIIHHTFLGFEEKEKIRSHYEESSAAYIDIK